MMKKLDNKIRNFFKSERGNVGGSIEFALVVTLALGIIGGVIYAVSQDQESQVPDQMFSSNEQLVTKMFRALDQDASVVASDITALLSDDVRPASIRLNGAVWNGPHGGPVVPTGTGARGFTVAWSEVSQDECKQVLSRYAQETGSGRLSGIAVNGTAQTLPLDLAGRNTACNVAGNTNVYTLTYNLNRA
ncbi:MAG: hypothetical protein JKY60_11975 [Kordiimonadaceae bacterium]|nr:hypothetical protein [Kordiimonadaceae bacterium]